MKIITAFDSFKGCMSAQEACQAAASGLRECYPDAEVVCLPMSDGGEGMVDCIAEAMDVEVVKIRVHGPLMNEVEAKYAISSVGSDNSSGHKTAYMEMAAACGLTLVPMEKRNPMLATTHGVGEMILDAIRRGCTKIVMGIGGSATCDGGQGMIDCLRPHLPLPAKVIVASDVSNPLYGKDGAAYVFAPQKGATPEQVILLDQRLRNFAHQTEAAGIASPDLAHHPGAGAAGGLGYGLMAYLNATLTSGVDLLLDTIGFDQQIADADLVLTGEGKTDGQTLYCQEEPIYNKGVTSAAPKKVPMGILARAKKQGIPTVLLSGGIEDQQALLDAGFAAVQSINEGDTRSLKELMQKSVAEENLYTTCLQLNTILPLQRQQNGSIKESEYERFRRLQIEQFEDAISDGRCYPEMPEGQFVRSK